MRSSVFEILAGSLTCQSAICLLFMFLITSCGTPVPIPAADNTPPTAALDLNTNRELISASTSGSEQTAIVYPTETIEFIASGKDNDGIKRISIIYDITRICGNLQTGQETNQTFSNSVDDTDSLSTTIGPTTRLKTDTFSVLNHMYPCGQDSTFRSLKFSAYAVAENYSGGVTQSGRITFNIVPFLEVATFNIKPSVYAPISRVALLAKNADIVFLQEVNGQAEAAEIARLSGLNNFHYYEGLAIVSRYPLSNTIERIIPNIADNRFALESSVNVNGVTIRLFDTHFSHSSANVGDRENLRVESSHFMVSLLDQAPTVPTIMGADINSLRGSPPFDVMTSRFHDALTGVQIPDSLQCSYPGIDFVMVKGSFHTLAFESVCPDPHPSDHPFVWVSLLYIP